MFKILSTKTLLIAIAILLAVVAINKFQSDKSENTFNEDFVKIDSASVTQIIIYPKHQKGKEIKISRNGKNWDLQFDKLKSAADQEAVRGLIGGFVQVKSLSLAAQDKSGWKELQIEDTSGTRIKFITAQQTYDFMIGKFGYNASSRNGMSYIRRSNEEAVYAVSGYMSLLLNEGLSTWRKKTFIAGNKENWTSLSFTYPGDSSFVLTNQNKQWTLNGEATDSAKVMQYLNLVSNLPCSGFVESYAPASTPVYTLTIQGNNLAEPITVYAYADAIEKLILHSNLNSDAYFSEAKSHIADRVFVSKNNLLN